jgi:hypothetical protein
MYLGRGWRVLLVDHRRLRQQERLFRDDNPGGNVADYAEAAAADGEDQPDEAHERGVNVEIAANPMQTPATLRPSRARSSGRRGMRAPSWRPQAEQKTASSGMVRPQKLQYISPPES